MSKNVLPVSAKGRKKLAPLNLNKSIKTSNLKETIKESESKKDQFYISREKFELDCDVDKKDDAIFLSKLSEGEKMFYETKAKDIYDFLKSLNLVRYIASFINDGFESKEDLMEIQEDYFEENKNFNEIQQKKILLKAKEYLNEYNKKNIQNNVDNNIFNNNKIFFENIKQIDNGPNKKVNLVDMGVGGEDINNYFNNTNTFNRCWTCFNKLKDKNYIEITYEDSIVTRIVRFCSEKCKNKFEVNIYTVCNNCHIKYDKSKGDFIYNGKHFHSQKCMDFFVKNNYIKEDNIKTNNNINQIMDYNVTDNNEYDPMNDF